MHRACELAPAPALRDRRCRRSISAGASSCPDFRASGWIAIASRAGLRRRRPAPDLGEFRRRRDSELGRSGTLRETWSIPRRCLNVGPPAGWGRAAGSETGRWLQEPFGAPLAPYSKDRGKAARDWAQPRSRLQAAELLGSSAAVGESVCQGVCRKQSARRSTRAVCQTG